MSQVTKQTKPRAVVLLSGGLDSATVAWQAKADGFAVDAVSFDYGQKHRSELAAAKRIAQALGVGEHRVIKIDLAGDTGSSLTDHSTQIPDYSPDATGRVPSTYVPVRNLVFLSLATGMAETLQAQAIYLGVNEVDYSGYPDCRADFVASFEQTANLAMAASTSLQVIAPLQYLNKAKIIQKGQALGVPYALTVSCYRADAQGRACGVCDSCHYRREGFSQAGVADPTQYQP